MKVVVSRGNLVLAVGSAVVTLVLLALIGEVVVRYRERHRSSVPGTISMLYYQHRRLGHSLVRGADYFGWMRINRQGFRGPDVSLQPASGVTRIMVVGSSTTFDTQVSRDDRAWPARLEYWLNQSSERPAVEVINAGVPGYQVIDDLIRLETELLRFRPGVILLYEAHNDISCALQERAFDIPVSDERPDELPATTPWGHWLQRHSLLYNKLAAKWQWTTIRRVGQRAAAAAPDATPQPPDTLATCSLTAFERELSAFAAVVKSLGIRLVLAEVVGVSAPEALVEPDSGNRRRWWRARPYADPDSGLRLYREYNAVTRRVAAAWAVPFIATAGFRLSGDSLYASDDPMHFNDTGADRMGQRMAAALRAAGVLAR